MFPTPLKVNIPSLILYQNTDILHQKHLPMAVQFLFLLTFVRVLATALCLQINFYAQSCPRAETIIQHVVQSHSQQDPSVLPALLRLHFHDCFVRGCDGSILIDSTSTNVAEKAAPPNLTLRMFDVIDDIKAEVEKECRGVVSCADIVALAARDAAAIAGGIRYQLPTGRRDGTVSSATEVHLPSPSVSFVEALAALQSINLNVVDLTTLLGAHTMGFCHCGFFLDRLYDYKSTGLSDPAMDPGLRSALQQKCPPHVVTLQNITQDSIVPMNLLASNPFLLDNSFYSSVLKGKAILQLDQELAFTDLTSRIAVKFAARPGKFRKQFAKSMIKLGNVNVLTGQQGEIRLNCRMVNNATSKNSNTRQFAD